MPLHNWTDRPGWEGLHHLWIADLLRWTKPRLPSGYRAYIGTPSVLAVDAPSGREKPDVAVRDWSAEVDAEAGPDGQEPDIEVATLSIEPLATLFISRGGWLVAAVELVSPRNKDRPSARSNYSARYAGYLMQGVHLLMVDVHPRPFGFSFADRIAEEMGIDGPASPPPVAASYRVGEPAPEGGHFLALWRRPLTPGQPLPTIPLPLSVFEQVPIDLEATYRGAAADVYLD